MGRTILIYGLATGVVSIAGILGTMLLGVGHHGTGSLWLGYLVMLVALSSVLLGVKSYRDKVQGGVIKFGKAFLMGLGIAFVASVAYAAVWELYLALTHYTFMDEYTNATLAAKRAAGMTGAAYQKAVEEAQQMKVMYANPFMRFGMTFTEIFPVGFLVALVSAALLRMPRFLPAKANAAA